MRKVFFYALNSFFFVLGAFLLCSKLECQENDRVVESSEVQETFENNLDKQASQPSDVLEECQSALNYDFYK